MDWEEGVDIAMRAVELHQNDMKMLGELVAEHAKATLQALGARAM